MSQRLKPPPKYANVPAGFLFDNDLPDPIFRSLVQIHALAWQTKGERTPPATVHALGTLRGLKERRMYDHLRELKERALIRIQNLGDGRIVIYPLRWADDTGAALSAASTLTPADLAALEDNLSTAINCTAKLCSSTAIEPNNITTATAAFDSPEQEKQQQNINNTASTAKNCSSVVRQLLESFGVTEPALSELLGNSLEPAQVSGWIRYLDTQEFPGKVGYLVNRLREDAWPAPQWVALGQLTPEQEELLDQAARHRRYLGYWSDDLLAQVDETTAEAWYESWRDSG